jgi:hypothetical protein
MSALVPRKGTGFSVIGGQLYPEDFDSVNLNPVRIQASQYTSFQGKKAGFGSWQIIIFSFKEFDDVQSDPSF